MWSLVQILKAISDDTRLRCLAAIRGREICLCHLTELLEMAPSTISKHLSLLKAAGLLTYRKDGRWVHYRWASAGASSPVVDVLSCLDGLLAADPRAQQDQARLTLILEQSVEGSGCP